MTCILKIFTRVFNVWYIYDLSEHKLEKIYPRHVREVISAEVLNYARKFVLLE